MRRYLEQGACAGFDAHAVQRRVPALHSHWRVVSAMLGPQLPYLMFTAWDPQRCHHPLSRVCRASSRPLHVESQSKQMCMRRSCHWQPASIMHSHHKRKSTCFAMCVTVPQSPMLAMGRAVLSMRRPHKIDSMAPLSASIYMQTCSRAHARELAHLVRHVVGDEAEVARVHADAVRAEDGAHLAHHGRCARPPRRKCAALPRRRCWSLRAQQPSMDVRYHAPAQPMLIPQNPMNLVCLQWSCCQKQQTKDRKSLQHPQTV